MCGFCRDVHGLRVESGVVGLVGGSGGIRMGVLVVGLLLGI